MAADLIITSMNVQESGANAGDVVHVDADVKNNGDVGAPAFRIAYYLSTDNVIDANDKLLDTLTEIPLAPGVTDSTGMSVTLPAIDDSFWQTNGEGNFFIVIYVDDQSAVPESNENNNTASDTIVVSNAFANDPPIFNLASTVVNVNEDAGPHAIPGFVTGASAGPPGEADEVGQTLLPYNVQVTGTTGNLAFSTPPTIGVSGLLQFTTAPNTNGSATVDVTLQDNGGTANGGVDSTTHTFTIIVNAVNDRPTFSLAGSFLPSKENLGLVAVPLTAFNFQPGPATATDEASQTLLGYNVTVTGTTGSLMFTTPPAIDAAGTLTFASAPNTNGTATIQVVAHDNGGTANGGFDLSLPLSFTLEVDPTQDYGDAPISYGTLAASNGARHAVVPGGPLLGNLEDIDANGQPTPLANGDDATNAADEDGVTFLSGLQIGLNASIQVNAPLGGKLDAFIDFNGDGDFADAGEKIFSSLTLPAGVSDHDFAVPIGAAASTTYARFRISTFGGLNYYGAAIDGEVEDYRITQTPAAPGIHVQPDLLHSGKTELVLFGSDAKDTVSATKTGSNLQITFNKAKTSYAYGSIDSLRIDVRGGNDTVDIAASVAKQAIVFGGTGNDTLSGGGGGDILLGGEGNDKISGRAGRDLLIGGAGKDTLRGGDGDDIVIGGSTKYDADLGSLTALDSYWNFNNTYAARASWVRNGTGIGGVPRLAAADVTDFETDNVDGEGGTDLFYANAGETILNRKAQEDRLVV